MRKHYVYFILSICSYNAYSASFDCEKSVTEIEKMICLNDKLGRLDEEMSKQYVEIKAELPQYIKDNFVVFQFEWLKHRNKLCKYAEISCLEYSYKSRMEFMSEASKADISALDFSGDDEVIKVGKEMAIFADVKGQVYKSYMVYPNTKKTLLKQLMYNPIAIGFSPYNTYAHPLSYKKGDAVRKVVSCNDYLKAKSDGFVLASDEPEKFVVNYVGVCDKAKMIIGD